MDEMRNAYKILAGKPEAKIPLGRLRCRQENDIRMDLREIVRGRGRCGRDSRGSGLGLVAESCEHGNENSGSIKEWNSLTS
jgi:hypothetical protein